MNDLVVDKKSVQDDLAKNIEKRRKVFTEYCIGTIETAVANKK